MSEPKPHMTCLLAVVPWEAKGPGWRNRGVTGYFADTHRDGSTRVREETIQGVDLSDHIDFAFRVAVMARKELEPLFGGQQGVYRLVADEAASTGEAVEAARHEVER